MLKTIKFLGVVLSLYAALPVQAEERFSCAKTLRLGLFSYGPLFSIQNSTGLDKELAQELARRSGCHIIATEMPRARIWELLKEGRLDMATSGLSTPERNQYAWFVDMYTIKSMVILLAAKPLTMKEFVENSKLRLGIINGLKYNHTYSELIDALYVRNRLDVSNDFEHLRLKMAANRFQATILSLPFYKEFLKQNSLSRRTVILNWAPHEPRQAVGLVLAKATFNEVEANKWRLLVNEMLADGGWERLLNNYFPQDEVDIMKLPLLSK